MNPLSWLSQLGLADFGLAELGFIEILTLLTPALPLCMALAMVAPRLRGLLGAGLAVGALPALALVILGDEGFTFSLPPLLLGAELGLDGPRRMLLGLTAGLWFAAALYSRGYIEGDRHRHRYNAFFLVTMGGNLGLIVALDVVSFYVAFSLMTLASYILVAFERTPEAYRAGRIYLVLSLLGEVALLIGFIIASQAAESLSITAISSHLAEALGGGGDPARTQARTALGLLIFGFSVKAGLFPLHVWLPLAHPAAPTPASAVLSGAMIKAGLLGLLLFLPLGEIALPTIGAALMAAGFFTAYYGAACGMAQRVAKTALAYSSLSQMGLLLAILGLGLMQQEPAAAETLGAVLLFYALHHGLAKGALFLSVGVAHKSASGRAAALLVLGAAAVSALSIAGAPLAAGSLAKLSLKHAAEEGGEAAKLAVSLLTWSAVATMLVLARFLVLLRAERGEAEPAEGGRALWLWGPFLALAVAAQAAPWLLTLFRDPELAAEALKAKALIDALWPVALAAAVAALAIVLRASLGRLAVLPAGDWFGLLPSFASVRRLWDRLYQGSAGVFSRRPEAVASLAQRLAATIDPLDAALARPAVALGCLVVLTAVLAGLLAS